jgi:hypothetical protein
MICLSMAHLLFLFASLDQLLASSCNVCLKGARSKCAREQGNYAKRRKHGSSQQIKAIIEPIQIE